MSEWTDVAPAPSSSYHPNVAKFLGVLGQAEGAGYGTIVGGSEFNNYTEHPRVVGLRTAEGPSTAAGRYQITKTTYDDTAKKLGINDFSPASQDKIAIQLIKDKGAYEDVVRGDYNSAMKKLGGVWASLPSSKYSQPKLTQEQFNKMANQDDGWTTVAPAMKQSPSSDDGWTTVAPAATTPKAATTEAPKQAAANQAPKKEEKSWLRTIDDAVRGVADTLTFGYADEIAAKMDQLTGLNTANGKKPLVREGTKLSDLVTGKDPNSYEAILAEQRKRDSEGGGARLAGQVTGALLPGANVLNAVRAPANATRLGRAAAGAGTGAAQGALYGSGSAEEDRLQGAIDGALLGGATGGVLGTVLPATAGQVATKFQKKAGDPASAAIDAEIIRDLNAIAKNEANRGNPVQAIQANNLEQKYVTDATRAIKQLGKDGLQKAGLSTDDVQAAVQNRRILTADELDKLRGSAAGDALADAIDKAQRTRSLTAPVNASTNPIARTGRALLDLAPLPQAVRYAGQRILGARSTREDQIQKLIGDKNAKAAEILADRVGPSAATQSLDKLQEVVQKAQTAAQAKAAAQAQAKAAAQAANEANKLNVLKSTRTPLGGGFQELLTGGRSNLNLQSREAIDALRLAKNRFGTDNPIGNAADQLLKSRPVKDENAFYGLQNWLKKTQESGVLAGGPQPGALSGVSPVRNPIAYQANVDNAMGALKNAAENAPSKDLAQFARKVAGTKSIADKQALIADRLKKASPDEAAYLEQFVSPLTSFGKK